MVKSKNKSAIVKIIIKKYSLKDWKIYPKYWSKFTKGMITILNILIKYLTQEKKQAFSNDRLEDQCAD